MVASAPTAKKCVRYALDVHFGSEEEKKGFKARLDGICLRLKPPGCLSIDNNSLLCAMFDAVEKATPEQQPDRTEVPTTCYFLRNSGKCIREDSSNLYVGIT